MTIEQAQDLIYPNKKLEKTLVTFTKQQRKSIQQSSDTRVRNKKLHAWKTKDNEWFIVDQVIGKHENIDLALAINSNGQVTHIEVLVYRESYGHEVRHPKWLKQFFNKDYSHHFTLDKDIMNISGATLSCRHITDAVNRLTWSWKLVLNSL